MLICSCILIIVSDLASRINGDIKEQISKTKQKKKQQKLGVMTQYKTTNFDKCMKHRRYLKILLNYKTVFMVLRYLAQNLVTK